MADLADQYQVLEELGSGSFGVVYKGIEKATGEIVAIKHIDLESSEDDIQDIQQEISVLSTCDSPFVTQYKTSFLRGYKLWIVMEYLGGGSCLDLLKPGPFNESHIAIICRELLLGLDYLHQEGKIHRDIKAANILLAQSGKVKLADFGVAAQLTNIKSQRNTFVGTPFWMAPEVIQQAGYDFKADIWSLGITAMELIHGEPPHANTHPMKVLFLIPKAPAPRLEGDCYSREFREFIAACLVKDPDRRPPAKELLQYRFIRNAGQIEHLQELMQRRQMIDHTKGQTQHPKYYEETLRPMAAVSETMDDWVFDTVKASTIVQPQIIQPPMMQPQLTQRRSQKPKQERIMSETTIFDEASAPPEEMMSRLTISRSESTLQSPPQTVRHMTMKRRSSAAGAASPAKRRASVQKKPLAPSTSFGNSPSAVKQFRRINSNPHDIYDDASDLSNTENQKPAPEAVSKEALLGRRAYSKAIDHAFQETYAQTASQSKREAIANVAHAWDVLNKKDPDGEYHLLKSIIEKVQAYGGPKMPDFLDDHADWNPCSDPKLAQLLPQSQPNTPQKPRLILAQNNPHLKSHRRRQSSLLPSDESWQDNNPNAPGQLVPGMEHTKQLADALYSRWAEGLKNRWPGV